MNWSNQNKALSSKVRSFTTISIQFNPKAKLLHVRRACILLKVDIAKAFDTVSWPFLLQLLQHMGFSKRRINWISILLSTVSTKIMLNGLPGRRICHSHGLRQGDSLSPMLFVLVMETLNATFIKADEESIFTSLRSPAINYRVSTTRNSNAPDGHHRNAQANWSTVEESPKSHTQPSLRRRATTRVHPFPFALDTSTSSSSIVLTGTASQSPPCLRLPLPPPFRLDPQVHPAGRLLSMDLAPPSAPPPSAPPWKSS